jgi:hypothetical protein
MKKYIYLLLLTFISVNSNAQTNSIHFEDLQFKSRENLDILKINENNLLQIKPDSQENYDYEMNGTSGFVYYYGNSKLYYEEGNFKYWELTDNHILIGKNDKFLKVGDPIESISEVFLDYSNNQESGIISISLDSRDYEMECTFLNFEVLAGKIQKIWRTDC